MSIYTLYWIKEQYMDDPYTEGYIGITKRNAQERYKEHLDRHDIICKDTTLVILHQGTKKEISMLEEHYRPVSYTGWNKSPGGLTGGRPIGITTSGWNQTEESNKKRSEALKGEKNPMYGKTQSDKQKEATRKANSVPKPHVSENMKKLHADGLARQWTTEDNPKSKKVSIDGVEYPSAASADRELGNKLGATKYRCASKSKKWCNWYFV